MFLNADRRLTEMGQISRCPATGKGWPPKSDSFTDGTSRRLMRAERREWRSGRLATRTSWLGYDNAVPWVALYRYWQPESTIKQYYDDWKTGFWWDRETFSTAERDGPGMAQVNSAILLTILQTVGKFGRWSTFDNALQCKDTVTSFKQNMY